MKILDQIVDNMLKLAPGEELDVNNVTLRFAMDVTGEAVHASSRVSCRAACWCHPFGNRRISAESSQSMVRHSWDCGYYVVLASYWRHVHAF